MGIDAVKQWAVENPDKVLEAKRRWRQNNIVKARQSNKEWNERNKESVLSAARARRIRVRLAILDAYGNKCNYCGYADSRALDLDHKNNDGAEERRRLKNPTVNDYVYKQGFPDTYQLLCRNCNWLKYLDSLNTGTEAE